MCKESAIGQQFLREKQSLFIFEVLTQQLMCINTLIDGVSRCLVLRSIHIKVQLTEKHWYESTLVQRAMHLASCCCNTKCI